MTKNNSRLDLKDRIASIRLAPKGRKQRTAKGFKMNTLTVKQASELTIGDVIQYSNGVRAEIDYIETANDFGHIRYIIGTVCEGEQFTQDFFPTHLFTVTSKVGA